MGNCVAVTANQFFQPSANTGVKILCKCLKFHSFEVLVVNCSTFEVQQLKIDNLRTQFYNEVQSASLESMNGASAVVGMSVVCQKGIVAG